MFNALVVAAVVALPRPATAQDPSTTRSVKECVSTPGVNLALLSACEGLRSQLLTKLTPGGTVALATQITLPVTGTDANGNPTGTFASPSPATTNAEESAGVAGASPRSGTGGSGGASATSDGANGGESSSFPTTSAGGTASTASASDDGGSAGTIIGGAAVSSSASMSAVQSSSLSLMQSSSMSTIQASNTNSNGGTASTGVAGESSNGGNSDPNHRRNHVVIPAAVAGAVGGLLLIGLLLCCCLLLRRRKKRAAAAAAAAAYHDEKEEEYNASRGGLGHRLEAGGIGAGAVAAGASAGAGAALLGTSEKSAAPNGHGAGQPNGVPMHEHPPGSANTTGLTALPALGAGAAAGVGTAAVRSGHGSSGTPSTVLPAATTTTSAPQSDVSSASVGSSAGAGSTTGILAGPAPVGRQQPDRNLPYDTNASAGPGLGTNRVGSVRDTAPERYYGPSGAGSGLSSGNNATSIQGATSPSDPSVSKATKVMVGGAGVSAAGLAGAAMYRNRNKERNNNTPSVHPPSADPNYRGDDHGYVSAGASTGASSFPLQPQNLSPAELADNSQGGTWLDTHSSKHQSGQTQSSQATDSDGYARSDSDTMGPTHRREFPTGHGGVPPVPPPNPQFLGTAPGSSMGASSATTPGNGMYDPFSTPPEHRSDDEMLPDVDEPHNVRAISYPPAATGSETQAQLHPPANVPEIAPAAVIGDVVPGPWRGSSSYSPHPGGDYNGSSAAAPAPSMSETQARAIRPTSQDTIDLPQAGRLRDPARLDPRPADNRYYSKSNYDDNSVLHEERPGGLSEIEDDQDEAFTPRRPSRQVWVYPSQQEANAFDFGGHVSPPASPTQGMSSRGMGAAVEQPEEYEEQASGQLQASQAGSSSNRWSIPRKPVGS